MVALVAQALSAEQQHGDVRTERGKNYFEGKMGAVEQAINDLTCDPFKLNAEERSQIDSATTRKNRSGLPTGSSLN